MAKLGRQSNLSLARMLGFPGKEKKLFLQMPALKWPCAKSDPRMPGGVTGQKKMVFFVCRAGGGRKGVGMFFCSPPSFYWWGRGRTRRASKEFSLSVSLIEGRGEIPLTSDSLTIADGKIKIQTILV